MLISCKNRIKEIPGLLGETVARKFNYVIEKNQGFIELRSFINPSTNSFTVDTGV